MTSLHDDIQRLHDIICDKVNEQVSNLAENKRVGRIIDDRISELKRLRATFSQTKTMPDLHGLSSRDANGECTNLERQLEKINDLERHIAILDRHVEELLELERQKDEADAKVSDLDRQLTELMRQLKELVAQLPPAMEFNLPLFEP